MRSAAGYAAATQTNVRRRSATVVQPRSAGGSLAHVVLNRRRTHADWTQFGLRIWEGESPLKAFYAAACSFGQNLDSSFWIHCSRQRAPVSYESFSANLNASGLRSEEQLA